MNQCETISDAGVWRTRKEGFDFRTAESQHSARDQLLNDPWVKTSLGAGSIDAMKAKSTGLCAP
jgi:hypothetical protein